MPDIVTFENDAVRLVVHPQWGGKIVSMVDRRDGFELLKKPSETIPESSQYGMNYLDGWAGGWDECFPAIIPGIYPLIPYEGISVPDHGELWSLPTTAVPTKNGITTVWHGLRFGYRLTRKLFLDQNQVIADYTLINLAPFAFRFVWGANLELSVEQELRFQTSEPSFERYANRAEITSHSIAFNPVDGQLQIVYPNRNRSLVLDYESSCEMKAYWSIVRETGGEAGGVRVAPITGRSFELPESIQDESAALLEPLGRLDWRFKLSLI